MSGLGVNHSKFVLYDEKGAKCNRTPGTYTGLEFLAQHYIDTHPDTWAQSFEMFAGVGLQEEINNQFITNQLVTTSLLQPVRYKLINKHVVTTS